MIALERDRLKKDKRRKVSPLATSQWCINTALCVVALMSGDLTAASDWLASPLHRGIPLDESIDHDTTRVELKKLFDSVPVAEIALWADPVASPIARSCYETALKWSYGYKLKEHVRSANVKFGAPVRSARLVDYYNAKVQEDGMESHLQQAAPVTTNRGRKWCERWRNRHGASVGCLRTREPVPLAEKRDQA